MMRTILMAISIAAAVCGADVSGEYSANLPEVGTGLLLEANGRFHYFFTYGAADYVAKGRWRSEEGAVILTTDGADQPPLRLARSGPGSAREIRVHVVAQNGAPVRQVEVALTGGSGPLGARTDANGIALFPRTNGAKAVEVHVPVYDVAGGPFPMNAAREFWIEINGEAITRVPFRNERLKVTENGLELRFWNAQRPVLYRRQN